MQSEQIRQLFINYFQNKQHKHIASSSLIPYDDNSLLFTNSGMVPFKNIFKGLEKVDYKRAVSSQRCIRGGR